MVDRVRRLSTLLVERYRDSFSDDFEQNKAALEKISIIRSKNLRNRLAGYITNLMKEGLVESEEEGESRSAGT